VTKKLFKIEVGLLSTSDQSNIANESRNTSDEDDLLKFSYLNTTTASAENILSTYLKNSKLLVLAELNVFPSLKGIFIELNMALSTSAVCKRTVSRLQSVSV